jgi:hypothetical protein
MNPNPRKFRLTEVSFSGGVEGYPALLRRGRALRRPLFARLRGYRQRGVELVMTREMLDAVVRDHQFDNELRMHWEESEAVVTDMSDEEWIDKTLTPLQRTDEQRPKQRIAPGRDGLYRPGSFDTIGNYLWEWSETSPWPSGLVDAETILELFANPPPDSGTTHNRIQKLADIREIAHALELTNDPSLRKGLCYLLYWREPSDSSLALPAILPLLKETPASLRAQAADTILAIAHGEGSDAALAASPNAGQAVMAALETEDDDYTRAMLAGALGQLRYEPAIPTLIKLLAHPYDQIRRTAAWSLGDLRATQAAPALTTALTHETDKYAADSMRTALAAINETQ